MNRTNVDPRLAVDDRSRLPHDPSHRTLLVCRGGLVGPRGESDRRVNAFDDKVVLERHGESVERSKRLPSRGQVLVELLSLGQCLLVHDLCEAVGLSSACDGCSHLQAAER